MKQLRLIFSILMIFCCMMAEGDDGWKITTDRYTDYKGVTLANGNIGIVNEKYSLMTGDIFLNGVFDKESDRGGVSRMVRSQKFMDITLMINGKTVDEADITRWQQTLDMHKAVLTTTFTFDGVDISYSLRAMRNLPYVAVGELVLSSSKDADVSVSNAVTFPEELKETESSFDVLRDGRNLMPMMTSVAKTRTGMHTLCTASAFLLPNDERSKVTDSNGSMTYNVHLKKHQKTVIPIAGAVCSTRHFNDPGNEAKRMAVYVLQHDRNELLKAHDALWEELWKGDIIIEGCHEDQRDVRVALYHLYSFQREGSRLSMSPMGLSSAGYNGHVFWDSEIWMMPPMLVLHPELARCHIDYRADRLAKARQRASLFGYRGAMFPWESDDSGEESTPAWCLTGTFEHHISADVAIAFYNYYCVTKDKEWLRDEGFGVIKSVADFLVSRAHENEDGTFSIRNVVGADEYAQNVDDNAFTNGTAKVALQNAVKAAEVLDVVHDARWTEVADRLKFHYMPDDTIKEHSTYDGEMIKQADVNLLAYPLGLVRDEEQIRRDIDYYEDKIDKVNGPAMGYSILSVLYSRLGETDKAYEMFRKSFVPNKRGPFGLLSESAASDNPYFATGAGGMLQAVIFGFCGYEITDGGIVKHPARMPKQWKSVEVRF